MSGSALVYKLTRHVFGRMGKSLTCYTCGGKLKLFDMICSCHSGKLKTYRHLKCAKRVHVI